MNMKLAVLLLMLLNVGWEAFLEVLGRKSLKNPIPACVADVYDQKEYATWRAYTSDKSRISVLGSMASYLVSLLLIVFDGYAAFARLFPDNTYAQLWSIVLLISVVSAVAGLPFAIYNTFVIEEKYGFNRSTKKTFAGDQVKSFLLETLLMGGLISLFAWIHQSIGNWVILAFAVAVVVVGLVISLLMPVFTRLFNKFTPLEEGELKEKLTALMTSHGYKVRAIEVMDASRRSTKVNAYFTGFGPMKTIVLYDTLVEAVSAEELCAVFAHELGHGLHHDTLKAQVFSAINGLAMAASVWLAVSVPALFTDFGFTTVNYGLAFVVTSWLLGLLSPMLGLLSSWQSRRAEYRADAQAVAEGYGTALVSALKLLAKKNLADLAPDPLLVKLVYSHPPLAQRIEAIEQQKGQ